MYMPSFLEISPPVPEKKIFKVFTIYGCGGHLGHVTQMLRTNVRSSYMYLRRRHIKFAFDQASGYGEDV